MLGIALLLLIGVIEIVASQRARGESLDEQSMQLHRAEQLRHRQAIEETMNPEMLALMERQSTALLPARDLLEGAWRPTIGMLRLDLSEAAHEARLRLEAKSMQDIIAYVKWLEEQPTTAAVHLVRSASKDVPTLGSVVEADIDLTWNPDEAAPTPSTHTPADEIRRFPATARSVHQPHAADNDEPAPEEPESEP